MTHRLMMAVGLAVSLGALPLLAQAPGGRGWPGRGGPGGPGGPPGIFPMLHQLDLSDAQREQLRGLMEDQRQAGEPGAATRDAEQKLHAAVLADTPDSQAIDSLKAALNTVHAAELDRRVEMMEKVAQILTPAQKQQLLKLQEQGPPSGRGRGRL